MENSGGHGNDSVLGVGGACAYLRILAAAPGEAWRDGFLLETESLPGMSLGAAQVPTHPLGD
jgi:hypothetical protein